MLCVHQLGLMGTAYGKVLHALGKIFKAKCVGTMAL